MLLTELLAHKDAIIAVLVLINIASFCLCVYDKKAAISKGSRIPERVLIAFSVFFGSAGMLAGMYVFRHKTRKPLFFVSVPLMLAVHGILLYMTGIIS